MRCTRRRWRFAARDILAPLGWAQHEEERITPRRAIGDTRLLGVAARHVMSFTPWEPEDQQLDDEIEGEGEQKR